MEQMNTDGLKDELMMSNSEFRDLAREHSRYEARLVELAALSHPNDAEVMEELTLKKKKLAVKDQMYAIMQHHQKAASTH